MLDSKLLKAIRALGKTEISWLSKCLSQADSLLESAKGGKRLSTALNSAKSFFSTKATGHSSSESDDPGKDLQNIIRILANVGTALNLWLKSARNRKASPEQEKSLEQIQLSLTRIQQHLLIFLEIDRLEKAHASRYTKRRRKQAKRIKAYEAGREKGYNDNRIFREILQNEKRAGEKPDTMKTRLASLKSWKSKMVKAGLLSYGNPANKHRGPNG